MKSTIYTCLMLLTAVASYAQGKVTFATEANSAITLVPNAAALFPADSALAGLPVPTSGPLPSGSILVAGLYAGTAPDSLSLQSNVVINPVGGTSSEAGLFPATRVVLTGVPGGSTAYFQLKVWDATFASYEVTDASHYRGQGAPFSMVPGDSVVYPVLFSGGATTWTVAPIFVGVPEPSTMALAGVGAAALLIFRRRRI